MGSLSFTSESGGIESSSSKLVGNGLKSTETVITPIALLKNRVVCMTASGFAYGNVSTSHDVVGFVVLNASANGNTVIQKTGELDGFSGMTVGSPIYFADYGTITQIVPTASRLQCLGVAISATKILIQISPPVFLDASTGATGYVDSGYVDTNYVL